MPENCPDDWKLSHAESFEEEILMLFLTFLWSVGLHLVPENWAFKTKWKIQSFWSPGYLKPIIFVSWTFLVGYCFYIGRPLALLYFCYLQFSLTCLLTTMDFSPNGFLGTFVRLLFLATMFAPIISSFAVPDELLFVPNARWIVWIVTHPSAFITQPLILRRKVFDPIWRNPLREAALVISLSIFIYFGVLNNLNIFFELDLNFVGCPAPFMRKLCDFLNVSKLHARKLLSFGAILVGIVVVAIQMSIAKLEDYFLHPCRPDVLIQNINDEESIKSKKRTSRYCLKKFFLCCLVFTSYYIFRREMAFKNSETVFVNPSNESIINSVAPSLMERVTKTGIDGKSYKIAVNSNPSFSARYNNKLANLIEEKENGSLPTPLESYGIDASLRRKEAGSGFGDAYAYFRLEPSKNSTDPDAHVAFVYEFQKSNSFLLGFTASSSYFVSPQKSFNALVFAIFEESEVKIGFGDLDNIVKEIYIKEGVTELMLTYGTADKKYCEFSISSRGTRILNINFDCAKPKRTLSVISLHKYNDKFQAIHRRQLVGRYSVKTGDSSNSGESNSNSGSSQC